MATSSQRPLELWGGIECTINRVGDRFFSQLERSGHLDRADDLDRIAALGIRTLRYPILWEQLAPDSLDEIDWTWADRQLEKLRALGIRPIIGLVHHGSGPRYTNLLDPEFPAKLARFARAVAERYPWVDAFTPVNEPLTTARFSGLYGHWFPHGGDELTFVRCLLNELRGVVVAMRAIREVNPAAQLVQTEDLGKTFATPQLQYQADFENERRWLTWDLLCGKVDAEHRMFAHLRWLGVPVEEIDWFAANATTPDVVGVNYYVTSERFLDVNLGAHPPECHGGNGRDRYADVAAVRAHRDGLGGASRLLREVWERYGLPVAVTEAHLGCSRDEQLRWFIEMWESAKRVRDEGADIRSVTCWSLLGAHSWNTLLTCDGCYEPGAFDIRGEVPRPTAIAKMIRSLVAGSDFRHPSLSVPGWWHRPIRFPHRVAGDAEPFVQSDARPLLVVGDDDGVADGFAIGACERALAMRAVAHDHVESLAEFDPWAVIYATRNSIPRALLDYCSDRSIPLVALSSAVVFDSERRDPFIESDPVCATSELGQRVAALEHDVLGSCPTALLIRTGDIFGTGRESDFVANAFGDICAGRTMQVAAGAIFSPAYLPDLVSAVLDLLTDGETGIWHVAHRAEITYEGLARTIARFAGFAEPRIAVTDSTDANFRVLGTTRGELLPPLSSALQHYLGVLEEQRGHLPQRVAG